MSADIDLHDGYAPRQLADIQIATNENLAEIVEPSSGEKPFQNAGDDAILQQIVAIFAEQTARVENTAKTAFDMRDPLTAVGVALSALVQLNAILRKPGSGSIIPVTLTGRPNTLIPAGSTVSDANGTYRFAINDNVVIPASGSISVNAYCTAYGPVNPEPGTVVVIDNPVSGWESVENGPTEAIGSVEETDAELRRRQQQSTNNTAYRHIEAIRAAVLNVPGVTFCRAYQNSTLVTDERGIPGKDVGLVAVGGDDAEIARAMFHEFGISQLGYGNTTVVFHDGQNIAYPISFSRPVEVPIWASIQLEIVIDEGIQVFPSNGPDLIRKAILNFAQSGHTLCEPIGNTGYPPGQDIIRSYLYTPINSIGGARVVSVKLGLSEESLAEQDIPIEWDHIGIFDAERIEVTFA
jgi:uncharacterized phage protein gp47/JayE